MQPAPLVRKVGRFLDGLEAGGMVVAVSGGPDSVALLRALVALGPSVTGPLVVAHLNHQLRGAESDDDEAFVRQLHATLAAAGGAHLELYCERVDVAGKAQAEGENLEKTARQVRYDWLGGVARERRLPRVATGHTADDQAETVLFRLLRGTGLQGLRGIAGRRALEPGVELVRPLLQVTRREVLEYLEAQQQPYCLDRSNFDLGRTRNRIRHELLPHLAERYNPAIVSVLCRLAEQAGDAFREQETAAETLLALAERPRAGQMVILDRVYLAGASRHLVREMFRLLWVREQWPLGGMTFEHWNKLARVTRGEIRALDLPGGMAIRCLGRVVQVSRKP